MKKAIILLLVLLMFNQLKSNAQRAAFGPTADLLQTSAHNLFYNANGPYYNENNAGDTRFNYWWNAHSVDILLDGYLRTRNDTYRQRMKNVLLGIRNTNGGRYENEFYDDMEWLAIACLSAYKNTGDVDFLNTANILWTDIKGGIRPEFGGAFQWKKETNFTLNACSNGPGIILAARFYQLLGRPEDLTIAQNAYAWTKANLVDPVNGAVWDNYNPQTGETQKAWIFSYNVGTWIGAALELNKITNNATYLNDAVKTAEYAMTNRLSNGVFWTNETGDRDAGLFKGIFMRYFTQLAREGNIPQTTKTRYTNAIKSSAQALKDLGINPANNLVSTNWTVRPGTSTDYSTQQSGVMLLEAASTVDIAFVHKDVNFGGYAAQLQAGNYSTAKLVERGVLDNDITSLTVPQGFEVILYENDNFTGASTTLTANATWLATWNDRASSVIVNSTGTVATLFQNCAFDPNGYAVSLNEGNYTAAQLIAAGIRDNDISSLKVKSGYEIVVYTDNNYSGTSKIFRAADNCLVDDNLNDAISSIRIRPVTSLRSRESAESVPDKNAFTIFPNPSSDYITIDTSEDCKVSIHDAQGNKVVKETSLRGGEKLSIAQLPVGLYTVQIITPQKIYSNTLIKN